MWPPAILDRNPLLDRPVDTDWPSVDDPQEKLAIPRRHDRKPAVGHGLAACGIADPVGREARDGYRRGKAPRQAAEQRQNPKTSHPRTLRPIPRRDKAFGDVY